MFTAFRREVPAPKPVSFGFDKRQASNVVALRQPTHFNGLRIVARFSDGSIEVAGLSDNFIISPTGASVRVA